MSLLTKLGGATAVAAGAAGAWLAWSRWAVDHDVTLTEAVPAHRDRMAGPAGELSWYEDRSAGGRPVVLLHGIHAAASAHDVRPLFERMIGHRPVLAPDLPGFGFSDRSRRAYRPETYVRAIVAFLERVAPDGADVAAMSLSCEIAARVAVERPDLVHSLVLISPTGFADTGPSAPGGARPSAALDAIARMPVLAQAMYDALTTRASLRWFLERSFAHDVDPGYLEYAWRTSHRPGARHAVLDFVAGRLFTPNAREVYGRVTAPTLVLFDRDAYTTFDALAHFLAFHPQWRAKRVRNTRGLPHWDAPEETFDAVLTHFRGQSIDWVAAEG